MTSAAENSTPSEHEGAGPVPAGRAQMGRHRRASISPVTSARYFTSASSSAGCQRVAVARRHDAVLEALGDLGRRVDDALLDERVVLAGERLVEVGPGAAGRARVGQRVAAAAALGR